MNDSLSQTPPPTDAARETSTGSLSVDAGEVTGTSPTVKVLCGVLIVLGVALAAFGVYRLVAGDSEVDRLESEVATLESELVDVEDQILSVQTREDELVAAALDLDTALINLEVSVEAFVDAQQAAVGIYNSAISPLDPAERPPVIEAQFVPAVNATEAALSELLTAQAEAKAALAAAQAVAGTEE